MAIDRFELANRALFDRQAMSAANDLIQAKADGDIERAVDAQRISTHIAHQSARIDRALEDIRDAYSSLGLEPMPLEALGVMIPEPVAETSEGAPLVELAPDVLVQPVVLEEELEITEESSLFGFGAVEHDDSDPVVLPAPFVALDPEPTTADGLDLVEDSHLTPAPVERTELQTAKPGEATVERSDELFREDRMIRALFGLGLDGQHFHNKTFAMATGEAFRDVLPPKAEDNGEFREAMNEMGGFATRIITVLGTYLRDPSRLEAPDRERVERFRDYLALEGYPADIPIEVLRSIRYRKEGLTLDFLIRRDRDKKAAYSVSNGQPSVPAVVPPSDVSDRVPRPQPPVDSGARRDAPRNGMHGLTPVRGKPYHVPEVRSASWGERAAAPVESEQMGEIERKLQDAIFSLNDDNEPVYATLEAVAEAVFAEQIVGLEADARTARVKGLVERNILPFIMDRVRAYTMITQTRGENAKILQRRLHQRVKTALKEAGYPGNLGPSEIGQLMTRQITLKELLNKKSIAGQPAGKEVSVEIVTANQPEPEPTTAVEYRRVDKLTDAQRVYLEVVYARDGKGAFLHPTKEAAISALYPKEYRAAMESGDKKALALLAAHFGRTGSTLRRLIGQAIDGGQAPAELRAFLGKIKSSPEFEGLDNETLLLLSQR